MLVVVLRASPKKERYSNIAIRQLLAHGHQVIPVNPAHAEIEGLTVVKTLADINETVHTVTIYVGPDHIGPMIEDIAKLKPKRVILNPGTESTALEQRLESAGIPCLEACTLVLLSTNQF